MPCGCLLALLGMPRAAIFITWLIGWYGIAFQTGLFALLGFLFMPWTGLCYAAAWHAANGGPFPVVWKILMVVAILADLGGTSGSAEYSRRHGNRRRDAGPEGP
ncbi:MAG: hypothetical protein M5U26_19150 [Planctomycetota bacterium]|nr:hypothetical protein [Planctomycetota bacterium]